MFVIRPDRIIGQDQAIEILKNGKWGVLSVSSSQGEPYGIPVNYFYSQADNAIYIHCALKGKKIDILEQNNKVSFAVVGKEEIVEERFTTHYESAIITGRASVITEKQEIAQLLLELCKALCPSAVERRDAVIEKSLPAVKMIKIDIEKISGKRNREI